jgi:hypothetical protein
VQITAWPSGSDNRRTTRHTVLQPVTNTPRPPPRNLFLCIINCSRSEGTSKSLRVIAAFGNWKCDSILYTDTSRIL